MPKAEGRSQNPSQKPPKQTPSSGLAGIIIKVELTNFMCHGHLLLEFNPKVNLVVGKNGSGKSAIMSALMVVLGTKASDTARGRSLAAFVRLGCRQACIKITLKNRGPNAYKVQKYGHEIVLNRTISVKGSSRLTVGLATGGAGTCGRAELNEILQALNISLPNPFALLTQETMKTFLNNNKPSHMYNLIEQGTGITAIKTRLALLRDNLASLGEKRDQMISFLRQLEEQLKDWKTKQKQLLKAQQASTRIDQLQLELAWASVVEEEEKERSLLAKLEAQDEDSKTHKTKMEKVAKKMDYYREEIKKQNVDCANARMLYTSKKDEKDRMQQQHVEIQSKLDEMRRSKNSLDKQLQTLNQEKKVLQSEISKIANRSADEELRKRAKEQEEMERNKVQLSEVKNELRPLLVKVDEGRQRLRDLQQQLAAAKEHHQSALNEQRQAEQNFDRVRRQSDVSIIPPAYGNRMPDLLREVDKAAERGLFKHKPIGPIGMHLKLKDYSWNLAVENLLRAEMQVFFCDNYNDQKEMDKMARRILGNAVPCVVSKFFDKRFDISRNRAEIPQGMVSLLDILDISDARLFNYLLDQKRVENILLCDNTQHAINVMQRGQTVPRKCIMVVTKDAEQVYPYPNFKVYGKETDVLYLLKNREANLALYEQRLAHANQEKVVAEREYRQCEKEYRSVRERLSALESRRKNLDSTAERLESAIRQVENLPPINTTDNMQTLREEMNEMQEEIEKVQQEKEHLAERNAETEKEKNEIVRQMIHLAAECKALHEKYCECNNRKLELEELMEAEENKSQARNQQLSKMAQRKAEMEAELANQRKKTLTATVEANLIGTRVDTGKSKAIIQKEIERQNSFLRKLHSALENEETVAAEVAKLERSVAEQLAKVDLVASNWAEMDESMKKRVSLYGTTVMNTYTHINLYFSNLFETQPIKGCLDVKLEERIMTIKTDNEFRGEGREGAHNLSGGERSFTTVALVLAVWSKLLIPFYMLDEFDVFMDMANRRRAMDMLLDEARSRPDNQFIFFTPQEMNLAANPDLTIHKLMDPRDS
ncbi:structural maintenance of chromosomes protein 6 [Neocloeon triangulifer]|uniref:structural maintenance of chromosomes protein 6 n=1 Tax=Neocloeon triangulifer TaxID=2078957 RepID=UPI00286EFA46|nr:structural maintenance of chromosomes protein 6 [Neocloeon triangulifer]